MKTSENALKNLMGGELQFEDLDDQYFINSKDETKVNNVLKLLNKNICLFQQIVDKFKSIESELITAHEAVIFLARYRKKLKICSEKDNSLCNIYRSIEPLSKL